MTIRRRPPLLLVKPEPGSMPAGNLLPPGNAPDSGNTLSGGAGAKDDRSIEALHSALNWTSWGIDPAQVVAAHPQSLGWAMVHCPRCDHTGGGVTTLLASVADGSFYCARCGHHGNARENPERYRGQARLGALLAVRPATAVDPGACLAALGLPPLTAAHIPDAVFGLGFFENGHGLDGAWHAALLLPVRAAADGPVVDVVSVQIPGGASAMEGGITLRRAAGGARIPFGWDHVDGENAVFTDHVLDALALRTAGVECVACMPETMNPERADGGDWSALGLIEERMRALARITLAFREHDGRRRFEEELARRIGRDRCWRVRWNDLVAKGQEKRALVALGEGAANATAVVQAVAGAAPFPVAGVHELYDVDDRFEALYEYGMQGGVSTGLPSLDAHYTIRLGLWTVVTGIPSHGKSTLLDYLLIKVAEHNNWRIGMFSPENQPIERHFATLMEKAVGAPFSASVGKVARITPEQKNGMKAWLNDHFKIILPDEENGNWTLDHLLDLARTLVYRHGIHILVIDPWNEIDHTRPPHLTETDYISQCLTRIRRFARLCSVHVFVVAHPHKIEARADGKYPVPTPYMIHGGAAWRNKADFCLAVWRDVGEADEDIVDVHIQKVRFKECGRVGRVSLRYDPVCGRYHDDLDQVRRTQALSGGKTIPSCDMRVPERRYVPTTESSSGFDANRHYD